jgi:hypothetical protein
VGKRFEMFLSVIVGYWYEIFAKRVAYKGRQILLPACCTIIASAPVIQAISDYFYINHDRTAKRRLCCGTRERLCDVLSFSQFNNNNKSFEGALKYGTIASFEIRTKV